MNVIAKDRFHRRTISRRTAFILVWAVGVPLGHGVAPWAISRFSTRYGWETGGPGAWNVAGLLPIGFGIAGLIWIMVTAFAQAPERMELLRPSFLLTRGPYAYSRHPMYVSELTLWLGWAVFYGSAVISIGLVVSVAVLVAGARYEERVLEARFGEVYRTYMESVPRWLGTLPRRKQ